MSIDLAAIVARFAALLVPGWKVTSEWCSPDAMPIKGALAACAPTPTRSMAHIYVVTPWPESEDIVSTIAHEVTHACLSPLAALLPQGSAAVMLEEQAVENIGKALAASSPGVARAMSRAIEQFAPQLRARISAPRGRANGGQMDPKIVAAAIAALKANDGDSALTMLEKMLVAAAGGTPEPAGDEGAAPAAGKAPAPPAAATGDKPADAPPEEKKPDAPARVAARAPELDMAARLQKLEAERDARIEADERARLFESRPDFAKEVRAMLERAPLATLRDAVATLPRGSMRAQAGAPEFERAPTLGEGQGSNDAGRLPADEKRALDEQMGIRARTAPIRLEHGGRTQIIGTMTADQARAHRAGKGDAK